MRQQEFVPHQWQLEEYGTSLPGTSLRLSSSSAQSKFNFEFEAIAPGLFRTAFWSDSHPLPPHPSTQRPQTNNGDFQLTSTGKCTTQLRHGNAVAMVDWKDSPIVSLGFNGETPLHEDLPFRSYAIDGSGISHYTRYNRGSLHVGLGEKAAPMDLSNRHFVLSATDCFGYDVHRTDPMYKHIPLLIRATAQGCVATFSTSHARGHYSIGSEMDGLWGHYKVYRQDHGGLEEYLIIGRTLQDVVKLYADLMGYPLLVPRWAFGYIAGGMKYSMLDEPRAVDAMMELASKFEEHDIPCSGFQMSSGYTVAETEPKTRNVFTWNKHRFPDPKGFVDAYHKKGIRLIANIKPYVLASHPEYQKLVKAGALFNDPRTGESAVARLWSAGGGESAEGGHIDFTSEAGYRWWFNGVKELAKLGIDCMWNDNNEYVIPSDDWVCALDSSAVEKGNERRKDLGLWARALHTELMGKSSHDALLEVDPHSRPFVLTRSATAGTMRYSCSSWSGDNITSWDGMRGANALSLSAGMCLLQCYGHDIGGFEGPQRSPELLLRWVQLGVHSPRFAINCFKTASDNSVGDVIEPWMYPQILPHVRKAIKRRYELIPYLYSSALESHLKAIPPQRWVGWGYEADPEVWSSKLLKDGETQYWLGNSLLVGGVFEPGIDVAKVYLPKRDETDPGYLLLTSSPPQYLEAGQWVDIRSPWQESIPVLAKVGSAVPVGKDVQVLSPDERANPASLPTDDYRAVEIFPPHGSSNGRTFSTTWYEDDGMSRSPAISSFEINYSSTDTYLCVEFQADTSSGFTPPWKALFVIAPAGDKRAVIMHNGSQAKALGADDSGRSRFELTPHAARPVAML